MTSLFIKNLYIKCKMHGSGDAQIVLTDDELYALTVIALNDLGWLSESLNTKAIQFPSRSYYSISPEWFEKLNIGADNSDITKLLEVAKNKHEDFVLYIENLCSVHRRRVKYRRILSTQPIPTMNQIGPRVLLEFGSCNSTLLANWMTWRKWIYDIDNRAAQETGYFFEPLLASCLGGESIGSRNSPVKRVDQDGYQTSNGRQIDCYVPYGNTAYEFKLRVTIAASGQGRFAEELSFPAECRAAGIKPVLLVLDPTPSGRLDELSRKYIDCGGEFYSGEEAWRHIEDKSGQVVSVFLQKYIRPPISEVENFPLSTLEQVTLAWTKQEIVISGVGVTYRIRR